MTARVCSTGMSGRETLTVMITTDMTNIQLVKSLERYDGNVGERPAATLPWVVLDGAGREITPTSEFLGELLACGNTPASCRSYAFDLLRWFPSVRHPW